MIASPYTNASATYENNPFEEQSSISSTSILDHELEASCTANK